MAIGLLGTFRSGGGAVSNAIFNTVFQDKFRTYSTEEIPKAAIAAGLNPSDLGAIIPSSIGFNLGIPNTLNGIKGITPAIAQSLREAVRLTYGRTFQFVFYITIPFSVVAVLAAFWVEDPTPYITNHVQSSMDAPLEADLSSKVGSEEGVVHFESSQEAKTIG